MRALLIAFAVVIVSAGCDTQATPVSPSSASLPGTDIAGHVPSERVFIPREAEGGGGGGGQGACGVQVSAAILAIQRGPFRLNRATGRFVQAVSITNVTTHAEIGKFWLALDGIPSGVTPWNPPGVTGCPSTSFPAVGYYLEVPVGGDATLGSGETVTLQLEFTNPLNKAISYTARPIVSDL